MKRYFYFMTSADVWFDMAVQLQKNNIAEPVFWLGDPCHQERARKKFEHCYIADMNNVIHYPWRLENTEYDAELSGFFHSFHPVPFILLILSKNRPSRFYLMALITTAIFDQTFTMLWGDNKPFCIPIFSFDMGGLLLQKCSKF